MKRVTQRWDVIDIDTYEDERHMRNILIKYRFEWADTPHSLDVLRSIVNRFINSYIKNIPKKIITPITYEWEWLRIIQERFGFRYEKDLEKLKKWLCRCWIYDESGWNTTTYCSHDWYTMIPPRDFLLLILNSNMNNVEQWLDRDAVHCRLEKQWISVDIAKAYVEYRKTKDSRYNKTYEDILWSNWYPYMTFYISQDLPKATSEWKWRSVSSHRMLELIQNATKKLKNNSLSLSHNTIMSTSLETTINEAFFADKKIINQASRAVEILQWNAYNLNQLGKFIGKFNTKLNSIKDDINSSFERKDKVRFIEAIEKFNTLTKFLLEDNQWSDIVDIAEEFAEEPLEFDPEEYLTN